MTVFRKPSIAFTAGAVGALVLLGLVYVLLTTGIMKVPANTAATLQSKGWLYRTVVWGGIWGLPLVLPILEKQWWLRGILLGILASLVAMFYFNPALQSAPALMVAFVFILNMIWGAAAAFWYRTVAKA